MSVRSYYLLIVDKPVGGEHLLRVDGRRMHEHTAILAVGWRVTEREKKKREKEGRKRRRRGGGEGEGRREGGEGEGRRGGGEGEAYSLGVE